MPTKTLEFGVSIAETERVKKKKKKKKELRVSISIVDAYYYDHHHSAKACYLSLFCKVTILPFFFNQTQRLFTVGKKTKSQNSKRKSLSFKAFVVSISILDVIGVSNTEYVFVS